MFSKITHKFYFIGALLGLLLAIGYAQLAFSLRNESRSALRAQQAVLVEREIRSLKELFVEIQFWEKAVFFQDPPQADREFGLRIAEMNKRLAILEAKPIDDNIKTGLGEILGLMAQYEKTFNLIIQDKTEQRLGQTLFDSNYQSLVASILRSNSIDLIKPLFNLSHFQTSYLFNHRESEHQAIQVVLGSLENKLHQKNLMDNRLQGYIEKYQEILKKDFYQEKKIQKTRHHFGDISSGLVSQYLDISAIAENFLKKELDLSEKIRSRLQQSFVISMVLGFIGILLIYSLMARQIVNPIRITAAVARKVKSGNSAARFIFRGSPTDEMNLLGSDLNAMLDTLEKKNQQLVSYQENLQIKVSELKTTQKELVHKAMEAGRAQLSAMVLHNIGNAMTPVGVYVESLKSNELARIAAFLEKCHADLREHAKELHRYVSEDPRGKEVFAFMGTLSGALKTHVRQTTTVVNKIDRSVAYIADILTLQQAYAAREVEMKEKTDLNRLIDDALKMQAGALEKRGIGVEKRLEPNLPGLSIEKSRLVQVLVNLIKNSYESLEQSADQQREQRLILKSFHEGGHIGVEVTDTGAGIAPDEIAAIGTVGNSGKGSSGFGLYYSKAFIEANNGTLAVSSPGKGKGATVKIKFPVKTQMENGDV